MTRAQRKKLRDLYKKWMFGNAEAERTGQTAAHDLRWARKIREEIVDDRPRRVT